MHAFGLKSEGKKASAFRALVVAGLFAGSGLALGANDGQTQVNGLLSSDPMYLSTWKTLVHHEDRLPDWVINLSGTSTLQMTAVEDHGSKYLVGPLCETPQGCDHERLVVAFSWDKETAYALLANVPAKLPADTSPSKTEYRWLGKPSPAMQQLLTEQLGK
ncbi:inhibitor of vertebrate lysozyme family protein [Pseudomonas sp. dw_358]|uniref:inhibitor of vertebrate lysozyme family protein n=1 Tax=Pseudomonas sp. dw_358 TaxID=2720083 RepID=UPI001BD4B9FC|nr:inhibitor of vertebrate lysozyme family protein [Pseudomonas sp. dw_358]